MNERDSELERLRASHPACAVCSRPAACLGSYDGDPWAYACDTHCAHGCEDGKCMPLADVPGWLDAQRAKAVLAAGADPGVTRRAADLTAPQLEDLHVMLRMAVAGQPIVCGPERIEILRDILRAQEGRP